MESRPALRSRKAASTVNKRSPVVGPETTGLRTSLVAAQVGTATAAGSGDRALGGSQAIRVALGRVGRCPIDDLGGGGGLDGLLRVTCSGRLVSRCCNCFKESVSRPGGPGGEDEPKTSVWRASKLFCSTIDESVSAIRCWSARGRDSSQSGEGCAIGRGKQVPQLTCWGKRGRGELRTRAEEANAP